ncbi:MAG: hypothetical protein IPP72_11990 [Chitinophagaceae bacterium]|nr:hypothetical protein [Chitinophagaceae bacterium]
MKSIITAAALCICSVVSIAQLNIKKEILVSQLPTKPKLVLDCNSAFALTRAEYKPFIDEWLLNSNGLIRPLNFHIRYTMTNKSDKSLYLGPGVNSPTYFADFNGGTLKCNTLNFHNIPFNDFQYGSYFYDVSLATNLGLLSLKDLLNFQTKNFTLTSVGFGIYTGTRNSVVNGTDVVETVVVIISRYLIGN